MDLLAHRHLVPTVVELEGVKRGTPAQQPAGVERDRRHVQAVIADITISTLRRLVVREVGIGLDPEILQGLDIRPEAQAADLLETFAEVAPIRVLSVDVGELELRPAEELHSLDQHRIVVLVDRLAKLVGQALAPIASTGVRRRRWGRGGNFFSSQRCTPGSSQPQQGHR